MKINKGKEKTTSKVDLAVPEGFITADILVEKFAAVKKALPELDKTTSALKVTSQETLTIAMNNMKVVQGHIKEVDSARKILKDPYLKTTQMIDSYCKGIDDMLRRFKERLGSEITNFKTLEEARQKEEQRKRLEELQAVEKEKTEESALLMRIEKQLNARLYGGIYYTKSGDRKSDAGCLTPDDCVKLHKVLNESIPPLSIFKHFADSYEEMVRKMAKRISEHQTNLMDIQSVADYTRKLGHERIANAKVEADVESLDNDQSLQKRITKEIRKEVILTEKNVASAGSGIREITRWKVIDDALVTRDFLSVDDDKIKMYLNENKEKILNDIQQNAETIPGIKFYIEGKYISR